MNKKIVALLSVLIVAFTGSQYASAASGSGTTSGGSSGSLNCRASLDCTVYYASAMTYLNDASNVQTGSYSLATTVVIYYTNANSQPASDSSYGTGSAAIANPGQYTSGVYATSSHRVSGSGWGTWTYSLTQTATY